MAKLRDKWNRFVDETKMATEGIGMVMRQPRYILVALAGFLFFAYLFAIFQDGTSTWSLLWSGISFGDKMGLLGSVFGRVFSNFIDPWGLVLSILAILQGLNISLLVSGFKSKAEKKSKVAGLEAGGVGAAISFVALGCPTCGTSLVTPLLTLLLGSSAAALSEALGWILTIVAAVLLLYAARKLGYGAYIETTARRYEDAKN